MNQNDWFWAIVFSFVLLIFLFALYWIFKRRQRKYLPVITQAQIRIMGGGRVKNGDLFGIAVERTLDGQCTGQITYKDWLVNQPVETLQMNENVVAVRAQNYTFVFEKTSKLPKFRVYNGSQLSYDGELDKLCAFEVDVN